MRLSTPSPVRPESIKMQVEESGRRESGHGKQRTGERTDLKGGRINFNFIFI